jgi:hypothetical protein
VLASLVLVLRDLDAAGLAAAADLDLRLDGTGEADVLRGGDGLVDRARRASVWDGDSVTGKQLLALIFEEVHGSAGR